MSTHYDATETRSCDARESALFGNLPGRLQEIMAGAPGWAGFLAQIDPAQITDRSKLAELPVMRKSSLKQMQTDNPPLAGLALGTNETFGRLFMSPGPIFEPMGNEPDPWHVARALYAAGFRSGELIQNCFSYHLTPGGFFMDTGARALGCAVIPAGIGNTELQLDAIEQLRPTGFTSTPDYLKIILDKAIELGRDASSITKALVSGGALFPSLRQEYADRGVSVLQCYATADLGTIAYESQAREGLIISEDIIVEIVRPGTGEPLPDGEVGEVVVTSPGGSYPLIRFATGDLSAVMSGTSPCGRTNTRLKGWMGRADQTAKVKGMFIHPSQIAEIAKQHPELARLRLVVERDGANDKMTLKAEATSQDTNLAETVTQTLQTFCKVRGTVELCSPESLPNDGLVISDERDYDA